MIRKLLLDYGISSHYSCCLAFADLVARAVRGEELDWRCFREVGAKYHIGPQRLYGEIQRMERSLRTKYPELYNTLTNGETGPEALICALAKQYKTAPETN